MPSSSKRKSSGQFRVKTKLSKPVLKKPAGAKPYAYKKAVNCKFRDVLGLGYSASTAGAAGSADPPQSLPLKRFKQVSYEEIFRLTQKQAKQYLEKHDVLLHAKQDRSFVCWQCGAPMVYSASSDTIRCNTRPCQKTRLVQPDLAFTPLHRFVKGSKGVDFQFMLRAMYMLGIKVSNDSAAHILKRPEETYETCYNRLGNVWSDLRVCLAWTVSRLHFFLLLNFADMRHVC